MNRRRTKCDKSAMTDIRVPTLGESVTEATIAKWFKAEGTRSRRIEPLLELETDKVSVEVPSPAAGTLSEITAKDGETVEVGALLGQISDGAGGAKAKTDAPKASPSRQSPRRPRPNLPSRRRPQRRPATAPHRLAARPRCAFPPSAKA